MRAVPLADAVEGYIESVNVQDRRYRRCLRRIPDVLNAHLGREATTADLTTAIISEYLLVRYGGSSSAGTVRSDAKRIVTLWRWCAGMQLAGKASRADGVLPDGIPHEPRRARLNRPPKKRGPKPRPKAPPRPDGGWRGLLTRIFG